MKLHNATWIECNLIEFEFNSIEHNILNEDKCFHWNFNWIEYGWIESNWIHLNQANWRLDFFLYNLNSIQLWNMLICLFSYPCRRIGERNDVVKLGISYDDYIIGPYTCFT